MLTSGRRGWSVLSTPSKADVIVCALRPKPPPSLGLKPAYAANRGADKISGSLKKAHGHRLGIEYMRRFALRAQSHGLISKTDESSGSVCSLKTLISCSCATIAPSRERFETISSCHASGQIRLCSGWFSTLEA